MDDTVVVELLVRLKEARCSVPIKSAEAPARTRMELPPPGWGIRQPRTRLAFKCEVASPAKGGDLRRNSPTTPLSWSAGTASSSGTADCYDESDLPAGGSSRSKVCHPLCFGVRLLSGQLFTLYICDCVSLAHLCVCVNLSPAVLRVSFGFYESDRPRDIYFPPYFSFF